VAGVLVDHIIIGVFAVSGMLTALAGALLSYSLAAASPVALADTLIPAAAAAIIGGVSLAGGKGTPAGIAGGVLVLAALRSGLTAIGVPPYVHDIVTGGVLLAVALLDAEGLERRLLGIRRALGPRSGGT
jgi:ribose/xylose/arabinose/galactoside ABC-type transport system permease subunit